MVLQARPSISTLGDDKKIEIFPAGKVETFVDGKTGALLKW